jgi:type I restriction enzyme S subunit
VLKTSCVYTRSFRVEENKTVLKEEENRVKCPVRKGAIIISRMNTPELVGASALVETDETNIFLPDRLWQTVFANDGKQNPKFIAFFMMIKGFRNQISLAAEGASSSMQNIAKDDYLSINILLPSIAEQDAIVSHLESKLEGLQKLDERINKAIEFMQERRTALISAAVTGKIDIRGWQAPGSFYNNQEINREDAA